MIGVKTDRLFPTTLAMTILHCVVLSLMALTVSASPLSPEVLQQLRDSGELQQYVNDMREARARGVMAPSASISDKNARSGQPFYFSGAVQDTFRVLVILVDFSDNPASGGTYNASVADFDHLLFSYDDYDGHYSMGENYIDNSYGNFRLEGTVVGWYRMPQTYAYYVDGQKGFGSYPRNAQKMAEEAIIAADPDVDYSQYDKDNNGVLDGVFIVHAGAGYEATGDVNQIHSHAWGLPYPPTLDGIYISSYTTEPEENGGSGLTTMGVFAHEYGHFIGLPDLYDTDYSSAGIGDWSLMAGGSWNYGGAFPAFMDVWCKDQLGFLSATNVTSSAQNVEIASSYHEPTAYRIWTNGTMGNEYFLIENRRKTGNDPGIPGSGLLIFHVDESVWGNTDENHPLVGVEEADGRFDLRSGGNSGDMTDPWSTFTQINFDDLSYPNTRSYYGSASSKTAVWSISQSDSLMTANIDINWSRPRFMLQSSLFSDADFGNGNGIPEEGETITLVFTLQNQWLGASNVNCILTSDNNDILFDISSVGVGSISGDGGTGGNSIANPLKFTIPPGFASCIDSFYLAVTSDNPLGDIVLGLELQIGPPQILVVDDDNGDSYEQYVTNELYALRQPFDLHDKSVSGTPSALILNGYQTVIWTIGNARANVLSAADVSALQSFMDGGGNLFLTGQSIIGQLAVSNPTFLNNYLRVQYDATLMWPLHDGLAGSPVGDGMTLFYDYPTNQTEQNSMIPINGSVANFTITGGAVSAVTYDGSYRLVLFGFGFEAVSSAMTSQGYDTREALLGRVMSFFSNETTSFNPTVSAVQFSGEISYQNVLNHTPTFSWSISDTTGAPAIEYEAKVGTGDLCYNHDNMWYTGVVSGADSSVVYAGLPLEDGQSYMFQVRENNGTTWSSWEKQELRMNTAPVVGYVLDPSDQQQVPTDTPLLKVFKGSDAEGDGLTYDFEVYSDPGLTSLVASAAGISQVSNAASWTVDVSLSEDSQYYWRSRCFDGYEYSGFTGASTFYVNSVNQAPLPFDLSLPLDGDLVVAKKPQFVWHPANDTDPADSIRYTLWTSIDPAFATYNETPSITDTVRTVSYSVSTDALYYWKVKAIDLSNAETWSSQTFTFSTPSIRCCQGIRGNANGDITDAIDIADMTFLVAFMFLNGPPADCVEEINIDGSAGETVDVSDVTYLVDYLFGGGPPPPACP